MQPLLHICRMEGVYAGGAVLVDDDTQAVEATLRGMLTSDDEYERLTKASNPYGDGTAARTSERIMHDSVDWLTTKSSHAVLKYNVSGSLSSAHVV